MAKFRILQIDAFTARPFSGNPAAVCMLDEPRDDVWMQSVAAEMNLSETAFLRKRADGFDLRWFAPKSEVDLCGHATLASAHALWTTDAVENEHPIRFHTKSGLLTCSRSGQFIEMDFPATPIRPIEPDVALAKALGVEPALWRRSKFDVLLLVDSEQLVRSIEPDFMTLRSIPIRGVIVTGPSSDPQFDFVSRFFAPSVGVDEDPVTGSAHCCLGPFWSERLAKKEMTAFQASSRGGTLTVRLTGDRVILRGQAVTVLDGYLSDL